MLLRQFLPIFFVGILILGVGFAAANSTAAGTGEDAQDKPLEEYDYRNPPLKGKALEKHLSTLSGYRLYHDPELQAYVRELGLLMLEQSPHRNREYHFFVLDSQEVNAFTPGSGLVYISRGLLVLFNSEAQLAGVLAHEIGHNIGNHIGETIRNTTLSNIGAFVAGVLTGSNSVMNSVGLANQERIFEARRENELEADTFAAEYMYAAQYDPQEFFYALSALADDQQYRRQYGAQGSGYHGVFSTHPRTDRRLQGLIAQAGELPPGEALIGRDRWREMIEGMIIGVNPKAGIGEDQERFINRTLGITFLYPKAWSLKTRDNKILLRDAEQTVQLTITANAITPDTSLEDALAAFMGDDEPNVVPIVDETNTQIGLVGAAGTKRVAIKRLGGYDYFFVGIAKDNDIPQSQDRLMLTTIAEFRRLDKEDLPRPTLRLFFHRLQPGETFASLAQAYQGVPNIEPYLRLINGYFPRGEMQPGMLVKMFRPDPEEVKALQK